jgi:diguanylate cyclase (GGDEF)-like protein
MRSDPVPSILITERSGFDDYLAAVRAGAEGYFVEPVDLPQLEARLYTLIESRQRAGLRVMLVDDDTDLLALCAHVLEADEMVVFREDTPAAALAGLEKFRPEVILLDVRMPECSGPELAQIIRLDERWMHVPIVYMSSQSDGDFQLLATRKAGEGFLAKPIDPKELVATVCSNGRHARHMIETTSKDSLTGLLRHSFIKDHLAAELERSQRLALTTCAVVVDIDSFKQVNDQHGHQVGDVVIRTLASLLRQRLRSIDGVGRLGGEEFLAVLSNCSCVEATALIDEIREHFASIEFAGRDGHFRSTFSAGIAQPGAHTSAGELLGQADRAMYRAKKLGRNRVVCGPIAVSHTARAG